MGMHIEEEDWKKVQNWLTSYRIACHKQAESAKHEKIKEFYEETSKEVRSFLQKYEVKK